jgi:putative transposase
MRASKVRVYVHLVWSTWDRLPLLVEPVRSAVYTCIQAEAGRMGCAVAAIGGIEDHVHVLARLSSNVAVASLVKQLKGTSSHLVTHEIAPGSFFRWQGAYGAFSVSPRHLDVVAAYIRNQPERHRTRNLVPGVEPAPHETQSAKADFA